MEGTDSDVFSNHLLSVCSALGSFEQASQKWVPGDEALACLRDLKRFLRTDEREGNRQCRLLLGKWKVIQTDLIPLLHYAVSNEQWKLGMATCEILIPLTWPLDQETDVKDINALKNDLIEYKDAFVSTNALADVLTLLINGLQVPFRDRNEKNHTRLKLLMYLFRNIICIQDPQDAISGSSELAYRSTLQEKLLLQLQKNDFLDFLLSLTGSVMDEEFGPWNMIALEIVYYLFFGRSCEDLLPVKQGQGQSGKRLEELLKKEMVAKAKVSGSRHARFGGAYTINMQSGRRITTHKLPVSVSKILDDKKQLAVRRQGSKKVTQPEKIIERRVQDSQAKQAFATFAEAFLENSFSALIASVKRDFDFERPNVTDTNHMQFIWVVDFFVTYWNLRFPDLSESYLASVLNLQFTTYLMKHMSRFMDDKKLSSLHSCVRTLRSLLGAINHLKKSQDTIVMDLSDQLQRSLFYDETNIRVLCMLTKDPGLFTVPFATSVVTTVDTFVSTLEEFSNKDSFVVLKRTKVKSEEKPGEPNQDTYESEEEEYENERISEREFRFEVVEKAFAYESVVTYYFRLLESFETLDLNTTKAVFNMFQRIAVNCKLPAIFFRPSFFYVLHQIASERTYRSLQPEKYSLVQAFVVMIMNVFTEAFERNKLVILEGFFPKKRSDCIRIQFGDEPPQTEINIDDVEDNAAPKHMMISKTAPKGDRLAIAINYATEKNKTDELVSLREYLQALLRAEDEESQQQIGEKLKILSDHPEIELVLEELDFDTETKSFPPKTDFMNVIDLITDALAGELPYHDSVDYYIVPKRNKKRPAKKSTKTGTAKPRRSREATEKKQEVEETKYKSEKFVFDSDDEMDDEAFFAKEAELRRRNEERYGSAPTLKDREMENITLSQTQPAEIKNNDDDITMDSEADDDKPVSDKSDQDSIFASDEESDPPSKSQDTESS